MVNQGDAAANDVSHPTNDSQANLVNNNLSERLFGAGTEQQIDNATGSLRSPLAEAAADIWSQAGNEWRALTQPQNDRAANSQFEINDNRAILSATNRQKPEGECQGEEDPTRPAEVSIYVRSKASAAELNAEVQKIQSGHGKFLTEAEFEQKFGANPKSVEAVKKFAAAEGLTVGEVDTRTGRITLSGTVGQMNDAFGCKLKNYKQEDGHVIRGREGALSVPKDLAQHIDAVMGLDERTAAHTHLRMAEPNTTATETSDAHAANKPKPMLPNEVASLYHFPDNTTGKGQSIAIIELGGNPNPDDYAKYYQAHGLPTPKFSQINVDGATSTPGESDDANGELALDAEVIGAVAPDAAQVMVLTTNTDKGFVDAIERAAFPKAGEAKNTAISISWGQAESGWSAQSMTEMDTMFKKAYVLGIGVYAASGDTGAKDGTSKYAVDFPASDPNVTGTGGTELIGNKGKITSETVWNDGPNEAGGGGISEQFPVPDYQKGVKMPADANKNHKTGRGVPDVAGDADPKSGYTIRVDGTEETVGGTSAVAPLFAALHARLSEGVGGGAPTMIGNLNPFFYKHGHDGIFNDITKGNNNGYKAGKGWDAATGWGSVKDGNKMLALLKADLAAQQSN